MHKYFTAIQSFCPEIPGRHWYHQHLQGIFQRCDESQQLQKTFLCSSTLPTNMLYECPDIAARNIYFEGTYSMISTKTSLLSLDFQKGTAAANPWQYLWMPMPWLLKPCPWWRMLLNRKTYPQHQEVPTWAQTRYTKHLFLDLCHGMPQN